MKKLLICTVVFVAVMSAAVTSYAITYKSNTNEVTTNAASTKSTVLIIKGEDIPEPAKENIVYVDQADSFFDASVGFLIKSDPEENVYHVRLGGSEEHAQNLVFYIGMREAVGDVQMTPITKINDGAGEPPSSTDGIDVVVQEDGKTVYNIGYTAEIPTAYDFNSVIIKVQNESGKDIYMGYDLTKQTTMSGSGEAMLGIQINGVKSTKYIKGIWLSPRTIAESNKRATALQDVNSSERQEAAK